MPTIVTNATGSTSSATEVWRLWNSSVIQTTSSATLTNNQVWTIWSSTSTSGTLIVDPWPIWNGTSTRGVAVATPEEQQRLVAERQRLNDERYAQQRARQVEADKAQARAVRLLREHLDERQRQQLDQNGYFELETIARSGERRKYRIHRKWSGNIQQVDDSGRRIRTLCIHPREATPIEDSMLAQKLMLEGGAEEELLRVANHS